jgi:sporulation protein YlmC with PRC-barrel domain
MDLVRDLLDKKVIDRHGRELGRVDRIVLELRDAAPPRVTAIELGPAVLAGRVRPIFGRWTRGLEVALGIDQGRPLRIPFADILGTDVHIKVDAAAGETPASTVDKRLRGWIGRIPGAT